MNNLKLLGTCGLQVSHFKRKSCCDMLRRKINFKIHIPMRLTVFDFHGQTDKHKKEDQWILGNFLAYKNYNYYTHFCWIKTNV